MSRLGGLSVLSSLLAFVVLAACSPDDPELPPDPPGPPTFEERIELDSEGPSFVARNGAGQVAAISARIPVPRDVMDDPIRRADWFLSEYGEELGIDDPLSDVDVRDTVSGEEGSGEEMDSMVTYERRSGDVPVFGGEIKVEVEGDGDGTITAVVSQVPSDVESVSTTPTIDEATAISRALEGMDRATATSAELVIFNEGMFRDVETPSILAWKVPTRQLHIPAAVTRFVDATDGSVHGFAFNEVYTSLDRYTYDAKASEDMDTIPMDADLVIDEAGPVMGEMPDATEQLGHDTAGGVWNYFWNNHRRDSHDGRGASVVTYVHYGPSPCADACNAFWWDGAMWFMDETITDDIFGHEYTHGLVEATAGLVYEGDSGALNESMADVFGQFYDSDDWTIGEGSTFGVLRSLSDPTSVDSPQPRHVDDKYTVEDGEAFDESNDYGGVHYNSGIPNYAAYLINAGGTNADSGIEVAGIGKTKTEKIYFRALTWYMTSGSTFQYLKIALRLAAFKFASKELHGVTYMDCGSVLNALGSVGIGSVDMDSDCFTDAVDVCPEDYNPDQDRTLCGEPICGAAFAQCRSTDQCCEGLSCVNGDCVDCMGAGGVTDSCDPTVVGACCGTLACSRDSAGGNSCCRSDTDRCEGDAECCGDMTCTGGRCACRATGESCQSGRDCCGSSFCDSGTCT